MTHAQVITDVRRVRLEHRRGRINGALVAGIDLIERTESIAYRDARLSSLPPSELGQPDPVVGDALNGPARFVVQEEPISLLRNIPQRFLGSWLKALMRLVQPDVAPEDYENEGDVQNRHVRGKQGWRGRWQIGQTEATADPQRQEHHEVLPGKLADRVSVGEQNPERPEADECGDANRAHLSLLAHGFLVQELIQRHLRIVGDDEPFFLWPRLSALHGFARLGSFRHSRAGCQNGLLGTRQAADKPYRPDPLG
jgi:hypothetical protein